MKCRRVAFAARRCLALLALAWLSHGCSSVPTTVEPTVDLTTLETYAWSPASGEPPPASGTIDRVIEGVVDGELAERGFRKVSEPEAQLLVSSSTRVDTKIQRNDPEYAFHVAEKYEEGTLTIGFRDAETGRPLWTGLTKSRLRDVARTVGLFSPRFVPTSEARVWPIEEMVHAIVGELPSKPRESAASQGTMP